MILLNCILLVLCCDITVLQVCSGSTVDKLLREDMRRRLKGGGGGVLTAGLIESNVMCSSHAAERS